MMLALSLLLFHLCTVFCVAPSFLVSSAVLICLTSLQLLGRSVDTNKLFTQRINLALRNAVLHAIQRFESQNFAALVVRT